MSCSSVNRHQNLFSHTTFCIHYCEAFLCLVQNFVALLMLENYTHMQCVIILLSQHLLA